MGKVLAIACLLTALVGGSVANADEEAPQQPRVLSERCEAWIEWLVDGNMALWVRVPSPALNHMAQDCLGRAANPLEQSPPPPPPIREQPTPETPKITI